MFLLIAYRLVSFLLNMFCLISALLLSTIFFHFSSVFAGRKSPFLGFICKANGKFYVVFILFFFVFVIFVSLQPAHSFICFLNKFFIALRKFSMCVCVFVLFA